MRSYGGDSYGFDCADDSCGLYPDSRADLVVRADRQLRQPLLTQLSQMATHSRRAQEHRAAAGGDRVLDLLGRGLDDLRSQTRVHRQELAVGGLDERLGHGLLERRVERDHPQRALGIEERRGDRAAQRLTGVLGEHRGIAGEAGLVTDRLEHGAQVADRDALAQQRLQHALDLAERQDVTHDASAARAVRGLDGLGG